MCFIWLDDKKFVQFQNTYFTAFCPKENFHFCVAGFSKNHAIHKTIKTATVKVFADTKFRLWVNDAFVGLGPVCSGGDFANTLPMPVQYYNTYVLENINTFNIYAQVQLSCDVQCDTSCGKGGFSFEAELIFEDGSKMMCSSDESWLCRVEQAYKSVYDFDAALPPTNWENAVITKNIWNLKNPEIDMLCFEKVYPVKTDTVSENKLCYELDNIYAGYICMHISGNGNFEINIKTAEINKNYISCYTVRGNGETDYMSLRMDSIGAFVVEVISGENLQIRPFVLFSHYPIRNEGDFACDDAGLNKIYQVGKHTLKICRQTIELDSPRHQENLGCTGDYFIESLLNYYCTDDVKLTRLDIIRTADYMRMTKGEMFHTTYSLIWVQMLFDYHTYSGDADIFAQTADVLEILMERFHGYTDDNEIIDRAPNYMFVDWIPVDTYNLHHPPRALGQTVMNAFYYKALTLCTTIFSIQGNAELKNRYALRAKKLKASYNTYFYDANKNLYFEGQPGKTIENRWNPENPDKIYYAKHSNTLSVLYELCDKEHAVAIMEKVINDTALIDVQPYFMHYVLEAVYKVGLFDKYGMELIRKWNELITECDKGMKEAWGDYPGYSYDFSHAWGATPTYQLPSKTAGLTILQAGYKEISLSPNLYGLQHATIKIPTPYGAISLKLSEKHEPVIDVPKQIKLVQ